MRHAVLVVLAVVGCRKETTDQKCDRLHAEAVTATERYIAPIRAEDERRFAAVQEPLARVEAVGAASEKLFAAQKAITCMPVRLARETQPLPLELSELRARLQPAIDSGRRVVSELAKTDTALDADTLASATRAADKLAAAGESLDSTLAAIPARPGRPWPAKQRTYLMSLETAWCDLENLLDLMIDTRTKELVAELNLLNATIRANRAPASSDDVIDLALDVSHKLARDSRYPVEIPVELDTSPGFAKVLPAIKAYNGCRK
jgi:hypothetical protein